MTSPPRASAARVEKHGRRAIVHDDRRFRPGQALDQPRRVHIAFSARSGLQIVLQIGILRGRAANLLHHVRGKRRAAEIGVQNYSRSVDHRLQGRRKFPLHGIHDALFDGSGVQNLLGLRFTGGDLAPQSFQHLAGRFHHEAAVHLAAQGNEAGTQEQFVHRGHTAQERCLLGGKLVLGAGSPWRHLSTAGIAPAIGPLPGRPAGCPGARCLIGSAPALPG